MARRNRPTNREGIVPRARKPLPDQAKRASAMRGKQNTTPANTAKAGLVPLAKKRRRGQVDG